MYNIFDIEQYTPDEIRTTIDSFLILHRHVEKNVTQEAINMENFFSRLIDDESRSDWEGAYDEVTYQDHVQAGGCGAVACMWGHATDCLEVTSDMLQPPEEEGEAPTLDTDKFTERYFPAILFKTPEELSGSWNAVGQRVFAGHLDPDKELCLQRIRDAVATLVPGVA